VSFTESVKSKVMQRVCFQLGHTDVDDPAETLDIFENCGGSWSKDQVLQATFLAPLRLFDADAMLVAALASHSKLLYLDLRGNHIGDDGAIALAACISSAHNLEILDLADNSIGKGLQITAEAQASPGAKAIYEAIWRFTESPLETVDLSRNPGCAPFVARFKSLARDRGMRIMIT